MPVSRSSLISYLKLMRLHRPIGIFLVLWPTLWALWLAAGGFPDIDNLLIFSLGALLMRSAGCIINDVADRKIDGHVRRTADRPLATGEISVSQALTLFAILVIAAFGLVLLTNTLTVLLSFGAVFLAALYPFMKRFTHIPQVFLGAAFAWSIPMAFAAQTDQLDLRIWLIFTAVLLWTVMYDTLYAMVDREDDIKIGVKSTAILFGEQDRAIIACLQFMTVFALGLIGQRFELGAIFKVSILAVAALFIYQHYLIAERKPEACFRAFLNNNYVGLVVFIGIAVDYAFFAEA